MSVGLVCNQPARAVDDAAKPSPTYEVATHLNVAYYLGKDADQRKHKLDLFLPKNAKNFPVLMFVHGGAWVLGDKTDFGVYAALGRMLASHGIGAVVTNYRLTPQVTHPGHIKDVARAFTWTKKNLGELGGRTKQIHLCGHSAGGHLVSLLATDASYLKAEGCSLSDIAGVFSISGVYDIPRDLFKNVFGEDDEVRKAAGALRHVHRDCPPFMIVYGEHDFPFCDVGSELFCQALKKVKVSAETLKVADRNHIDIIARITKDDDPCAKALLKFIETARVVP
jgi:acetyl esterase/lipase